jgi:alpha-ketoglutarate-dependent taurine dioxygenase
MMNSGGRFREYAAECVQRATDAPSTGDKNLHLNMALAWVRLAQQTETLDQELAAAHPRDLDEDASDESVPGESALSSDSGDAVASPKN